MLESASGRDGDYVVFVPCFVPLTLVSVSGWDGDDVVFAPCSVLLICMSEPMQVED